MSHQYFDFIWAILLPTKKDAAQAAVHRAWNEEYTDSDEEEDLYKLDAPPLVFLEGTGRFCAVCAKRDSSLFQTEEQLAPRLVALVGEPIYTLNLEGLDDPDRVREWSAKGAKPLKEWPYDLAARLGCPIPRPTPAPRPVKAEVAVVEGVEPEEVAATLPPNLRLRLRFERIPRGTLVSRLDGAGSVFAIEIGEELSQARIYTVVVGPQPGRFWVLIQNGWEVVGAFEPGSPSHFPRVDEVLGKRDPREICEALGVPPERLSPP